MGIIVKNGVQYGTHTDISGKVDKVAGKGLSTNDYTDDDKEKLLGVENGAQVNTITGVKGNSEEVYRTGDINITKSNIGLSDVDNTSDLDKPISTATQAELDKRFETVVMTMAQYEALTQAQKMDGTVRFITDANSYPDAGGVGF